MGEVNHLEMCLAMPGKLTTHRHMDAGETQNVEAALAMAHICPQLHMNTHTIPNK